MRRIILLGLQALFLWGCSAPPPEEAHFDLNGSSQLQLLNESPDSIAIVLDNWPYLPADKNQHLDTIIPPGELLNLDIIAQNRHYYKLTIDTQEFRLFTQPNMTSELQITGSEHRVRFSGKHKEIHAFLAKRNPHSDWAPRTYWHQGGGSLAALLTAYDSITDRQKQELHAADKLPAWYSEFENLRLDYVNAESKLSSVRYRYKMLGIQDSIPKNFFERTTGTLPLERADFAGVDIYMRFLGWYITYQISPLPPKKNPDPKDQSQAFPLIRTEVAEQSLANQEIRDVFLAGYYTHILDKGRHLWQDEWLTHIHDPELSGLVAEQALHKPILPAGSDLPYFYLKNEEGKSFEPKDFKGKILLINFWATWCKACYKGFEHENQLLRQFKDEPVAIVNICIDSKADKWKSVLEKYQLEPLNLFADDQWSETINTNFGTSALPQSLLVDANGKVVQNKCARPGAGADKLIRELLVSTEK